MDESGGEATKRTMPPRDPESLRLEEDARRAKNWKRWGPYLSERQWGTVREDYSADGNCWDYFPHDHARSRAYRWGEDGLLGIADRQGRLCFAVALWNRRDPILKERLFGLGGTEGNHGEDVKEAYFYLDSTPTHSWTKALYKYPQSEYPYSRLVEENRRRGKDEREFELLDTGVFESGRYFDIFVEYAKAAPEDVLIRITAANRGPEPAPLDLLPTLWFRNTWSWGCTHEGCEVKPIIERAGAGGLLARHVTLGAYRLEIEPLAGAPPRVLFTENETNLERLFGAPNPSPWVKDAFHEFLVEGRQSAVNPAETGTKAAALYRLLVPAGEEISVRLRLIGGEAAPGSTGEETGPRASGDRGGADDKGPSGGLAHPERPGPESEGDLAGAERESTGGRPPPFGPEFERTFQERQDEADAFFASKMPRGATAEEQRVMRQGYAGLLWSKQFYHYVVKDWLTGDPDQPPPPPSRRTGRNAEWTHLFNRDVLSVPDKWEYPWYAAWDTAFHMIPFARIDPELAKQQLVLFLREWYMHPSGQIPAYEFALGDVNPPVHAWAAWRVYKMTGARGRRDRRFLASVFQKLLLNFTWWVNRKDTEGKNLFSGGFLGLDNIGVFDRSKPLPSGESLEQADGTAWMAFFCATMLSMALELAREDPVYEDMASKFFEHFVRISDAMNALGGTGLWDERDGFYYDQLRIDGTPEFLRIRSMVGLIPLIACEVLEESVLGRLPGFAKRMRWFVDNRRDLSQQIAYMEGEGTPDHRLLAIPSRERLERVLRYLLDEEEFLSPFGIRSVSRVHEAHPFVFRKNGVPSTVAYVPGESTSGLFGGNSNWRGPIWFPLNFLLVEALERYHHFYADTVQVECPTGSGRMMNLRQVARELSGRLSRIFLADASGRRPFSGEARVFDEDPHWRDLVLFYEHFHPETGRGLGASHQTGWTALAVRFLEDQIRSRERSSVRTRDGGGGVPRE